MRSEYNRIYKDLVEKIYNKELNNKNTFLQNNEKIPSFYFDAESKQLTILFFEDKLDTKKSLNDFYNILQNVNDISKKINDITINVDDSFETEILDRYVDIISIKNKSRVRKFNTDNLTKLKAFDDIIEYTINKNLSIFINKKPVKVLNGNIDIKYKLKEVKEGYIFSHNVKIENLQNIIYTKKDLYIMYNNILYKSTQEFIDKEIIIMLEFILNLKPEIILNKEEFLSFTYLILPNIKEKIVVEENLKEEIKKIEPKTLDSLLYLDFNNDGDIVAELKFKYDDIIFNPLEQDLRNINRNILQEAKILQKLQKTGFLLNAKNKNFIMNNNNLIYEFISNEIGNYSKVFKIYATENFDKKQIKASTKISLGVKIENNLLNLNFENLDLEKEELKDILQKYRLKKKYHRLKDGTFVKLKDNEEIEFIDNLLIGMDISFKELENEYISLPVNRTLYLDRLLNANNNINLKTDEKYEQIVNNINLLNQSNIEKQPKGLNIKLRDYQLLGYKWLKILDSYNLGGILADDMGLGKTVQILSVILDYIEQNKEHKTSIIITPSSLALNWKSEIEKFIPKIKSVVISGTAYEREKLIKNIEQYDIIITSYELLKRDIQLYLELNYEFRYIVADEAQYIKNSNTQNSKAIKKIKGQTKYALTGTPIENSLNELWSIFDFIMQGYLFTYKKFKQNYEMPIVKDEDKNVFDKLKMIVQPFILRRTKEEVLRELPNKTTTVLNNEMLEEQNKIYLSYLSQARDELYEEIELKGFANSRIKILALLTRLRQICCHPSLFITNYKEGSGKLAQCIELIKDGINSGHKILLFSGYTSMFEIIEKEIQKEKINYLKLTGNTKVSERLELIERFNKEEDTKLFLISLKAGGTGINLTSADMVIHYDPWWNLAVENQATDRTHRIGQTKKVQVYKLITKNSIEEKIYELQKRKEKLIDNMLSTDIKFINNLTKEDIMSLFD